MKLRQTITASLAVLIAVFTIFAQSLSESPLPAPTGMVNDYANIIDDTVQAQIEQKLREFNAKTNPQVEIAVVTVETTGERPIFDYTFAVARGWKIGSKDDDNPSALMLIAINDKKYFTQISKDLEDELPDGIAGQLQRQYLVPAFKQGNYSKGVNDTVDAFIRTIEQRASAPSGTPQQSQPEKSGISNGTLFCCCLIVIVVIILFIIFSSFGKRGGGSGGSGSGRDRWRGGGFGGVGPVVIWGSGGDSGGSSWGSSSSGGGDSWGGFGGGGDFGGGGAGGDW